MLVDAVADDSYFFPRRYRNFVSFCPFGQMIVIAGFGNLAGTPQTLNLKPVVPNPGSRAHCLLVSMLLLGVSPLSVPRAVSLLPAAAVWCLFSSPAASVS